MWQRPGFVQQRILRSRWHQGEIRVLSFQIIDHGKTDFVFFMVNQDLSGTKVELCKAPLVQKYSYEKPVPNPCLLFLSFSLSLSFPLFSRLSHRQRIALHTLPCLSSIPSHTVMPCREFLLSQAHRE